MGRTPDQLGQARPYTLDELLGDELALDELVTQALGRDGGESTFEVVAYSFGSPATGGLYRLRGQDWSLFCKVLQHPKHWPVLHLLPPAAQEQFLSEFPWRIELDLWEPVVLASVPSGMRAPALHRVIDLGDDRLAVWMEDVAESGTPWDLDRYVRAADLLGKWNARSRTPELLGPFPIGYALRMYAQDAVATRGLGPLRDDDLWSHPWLVDHADLRARLLVLGDRIPELLDRLDRLPQAMPHGDASPQNLLVPAADPGSFVVIDVGMRTPHALGFDLGQLLVGLVHAGVVPASSLPWIADAIVPAYVAGLAAEGDGTSEAEIHDGFAISALIRSGFDSFLYDLLADPTPENEHTFAERVALCRFLADRAEAVI
jgi:hypothetical protein